jgi:hypothetical protein
VVHVKIVEFDAASPKLFAQLVLLDMLSFVSPNFELRDRKQGLFVEERKLSRRWELTHLVEHESSIMREIDSYATVRREVDPPWRCFAH